MLRNGKSNVVIGALNGAFGDLSTSLQSTSNSTAVRLAEKANAKAEHDKDYYGAIQLYNDAITHNPLEFRFYLNRCLCYVKLGLYQLALDDAQQAIKLNPTLAKCYFRKGQALLGLKKFLEAEKAFKEVLLLDNNCQETNQELVKVRYEALLNMNFDENSALLAASKYESIQEATEALLSETFNRDLLGSVAAARNVRDIWSLERSLTLNQTAGSRCNPIANYVALSNSTYAHTSAIGNGANLGPMTSSLVNTNANLRQDSKLRYITGLDQSSEMSPIASMQMGPSSFSLNGQNNCLISNGVNMSTVNFSKTSSNTNHRSVPFSGNEFGFGFNENDTLDCGNNILNTLNTSQNSISNNQQNHHQLNTSQLIPDNVFGPSTSKVNLSVPESTDSMHSVATSNGYLYNPFNQLPDSKLIDAIVPNLVSSQISASNIINSKNKLESSESINSLTPPLAKSNEFNVQEGINNTEMNNQFNGPQSTTSSAASRHPTSYSDVVKRTKKAESTKVTKSDNYSPNSNEIKTENGDSVFERKNGCESPNNSENKEIKQVAASVNSSLVPNVPTNLWGYNGLRVANVSNNCSKSTLFSLFSKHGNVKLIEKINNKIVENNLWVYYDNPVSPVEAIIRLQNAVIEGINANGQPLQLYFAPTNDQKDLKFSRPKQPPDSKGECYYWRTTNCFSRNNCDLLHIPANKNIDAQIWMKMKDPKDGNQDGVSLNGGH